MRTSILTLALCVAIVPGVATQTLSLTPLGTIKSGPFRADDPRVAEINAYDAAARRVCVVNPLEGWIDILDASDPASPQAVAPLLPLVECQAALAAACPLRAGLEPNSVAILDDLLAVAMPATRAPTTATPCSSSCAARCRRGSSRRSRWAPDPTWSRSPTTAGTR